MNNIVLSVIIPTYKPQDFLTQCLDNLILQDFSEHNFEVLIILNGKKEPYYSNLRDYLDKQSILSNFRLFYNETPSVSSARNIGIINSIGQYIAFIDDDDLISETYLSALYKKATINGIVISNFKTFTDSYSDNSSDYLTSAYNKAVEGKKSSIFSTRSFFSNVCGKLIPREVISNSRFPENMLLGEDSVFMFDISKRIQKITFAEYNAIYYRRIRPYSASNNNNSLLISQTFLEIKAYVAMYFKNPMNYNLFFFALRIAASLKVLIIKKLKCIHLP